MDENTLQMLLKRFPCATLPTGNTRTCPVRLSYPNLFKPRAQKNDDGTMGREVFSTALLFPKGAVITALKSAAERVAVEKFGNAWASRRIHLPFRDQAERTDDKGALPPGYVAGAVFMNVSANKDHPPSVVRRDMTKADAADIYPGVWALVTLRAYAYDRPQRKGIAFGLQNVMKLLDGERLAGGGGGSVSREFEPIDGLDDIEAMFAANRVLDEPVDLG